MQCVVSTEEKWKPGQGEGTGRSREGLEGLAGYTEAGSAVRSAGGQTELKGEQDQIKKDLCTKLETKWN